MRRRLSFLFVLVLLLSACFEYDGVVHINDDGSGTAEFAYRVPLGLLEKTDLEGRIPLTDADVSARYQMRAGITQYRSEVRELPGFREVRIYVTFDQVESLTERGNIYSYTVEGPYRVFRVQLDKTSAGTKKLTEQQNKVIGNVLDRYKIRYKVFMPDKIEQSNAQRVEWNAATWEIPMSAFLNPSKNVIVLEAKMRVSLWERLKWHVGNLFS